MARHKGNWKNLCAITDKPVEESSEVRWEDVRAERMHEVAKTQRCLDTTKEEGWSRSGGGISRYPRRAAFKVPAHDGGGDMSVQVKVPPERKLPPLVKHAAGVWEAASSGSDAWRATPPTRMLIRKGDAASMIGLRILPNPATSGKQVSFSKYDPQRTAITAGVFGHDQEGAGGRGTRSREGATTRSFP